MTSDEADGTEPEDAFLLFAHEIRIGILLALWESADHALSFSELRDRVGVRDSAKFNYHLSKLAGRFVDHDEAAGLYRLTYPGHRIVDTIQSGVLHGTDGVDGAELDTDCIDCGAPLRLSYEDLVLSITCPGCETTHLASPLDPGIANGRDPGELAAAFDRTLKYSWQLAHLGVCPSCSGRTSGRLVDRTTIDDPFAVDHPVVVAVDCEQCSYYNYPPVGALVLSHPDVVALLREQGIDYRLVPLWSFPCVVDGSNVSGRSNPPDQVEVTVPTIDSTVTVEGDERLSITSVARHD